MIEWISNFYNEILNWRKKTHGNKLQYNDDSLIIENPIVGTKRLKDSNGNPIQIEVICNLFVTELNLHYFVYTLINIQS